MTDYIKRHDDGKFARHTSPPGGPLSAAALSTSQADLAAAAYEPGTPDADRADMARSAISGHAEPFAHLPEDAEERMQVHLNQDSDVLRALDRARDAVTENPSDFGQILAEGMNDLAKTATAIGRERARNVGPDGRVSVGMTQTSGLVSLAVPAESGAEEKAQAELAIACYEPGTPDADRLRLARTAIKEYLYSFENVGQDAGEALDYHIQDDTVVLKALDASGDEVGENPSDFGQILAEQIFDDVNAAEEAKWSTAYHAEKRAPNGRPGTGNLDGYDKRPPAGLVNISRRETSDDEDSEQFDGPYDVRDPKHPVYTDRVLSSGRGSHDSRGRWSPGPTQVAGSVRLSLDDLGGARSEAEQRTRPPVGVNISLPEFPEDAFAENEAKSMAEDEAREKALAEEGERYREQVRISREAGRGGGNLRPPPRVEWSSGGSRTSPGSSGEAWSPGVSDPQRNAGSHVIR